MGQIARDCNLDAEIEKAERARALHRIVRAMHDGHCPQCGWLGDASTFVIDRVTEAERHECPVCHFHIFDHEAEAALAEFKPYLRKSLEIFEEWRKTSQSLDKNIPISEASRKHSTTVARLEGMSPDGILRLTRQMDGDIIVEIVEGRIDGYLDNEPGKRTHVEFCASPCDSPRTLAALKNLMIAMAKDNLDRRCQVRTPPEHDPLVEQVIAKWQ